MAQKLCIRNKILLAFLVLLVVDLGVVFLLENQAKRELLKNQSKFNEAIISNSLFDVIFAGNIYSMFLLTGEEGHIDPRELTAASLSVLEQFRNRIFVIFGVSLILGIGITLFFALNVTRSIVQLAGDTGQLDVIKHRRRVFFPECVKMQALTDSIEKMQKDVLEREQEKSRQESVELTKNLAAGIAHEIKNPINTVGLTVDYLQANLSPEDPEKRYEFFKLSDNMKIELQRINRIVEGFLRLTKPSVFDFKHEDINTVIRTSVTMYESEAVKEGVKINIDLDDNLPAIKIDHDKLNQVFSNLIVNAIEAMPRGGEIVIRSGIGDNGKVEVNVSDNGMGIPNGELNNVFSPYFTTKKHGFGLGLALIQNIVHKHHGRVSVSSEKGVGTSFAIQLPVDFQDE
jgi:signal transduction histidine kinase